MRPIIVKVEEKVNDKSKKCCLNKCNHMTKDQNTSDVNSKVQSITCKYDDETENKITKGILNPFHNPATRDHFSSCDKNEANNNDEAKYISKQVSWGQLPSNIHIKPLNESSEEQRNVMSRVAVKKV